MGKISTNYNRMNQNHANMSAHNTLMQKFEDDDEHLEGSGKIYLSLKDLIN